MAEGIMQLFSPLPIAKLSCAILKKIFSFNPYPANDASYQPLANAKARRSRVIKHQHQS